jgi:hypothetical protein
VSNSEHPPWLRFSGTMMYAKGRGQKWARAPTHYPSTPQLGALQAIVWPLHHPKWDDNKPSIARHARNRSSRCPHLSNAMPPSSFSLAYRRPRPRLNYCPSGVEVLLKCCRNACWNLMFCLYLCIVFCFGLFMITRTRILANPSCRVIIFLRRF